MSGEDYFPPRPAIVTPDAARDVSRGYKGLADQLASLGMHAQASRLMLDAQWWITYAIALGQHPPSQD